MPTEQDILDALKNVMDPELGRNIVEIGMIRDLKVSAAGEVSFTLALTIPDCPMRDQIAREARKAAQGVPGVTKVDLTLGAMNDEERKAAIGSAQVALPKLNPFNKIGQTIAILSGKGGVGKSSVTARLAVALTRQGQKVGILDADITGPSIPKLFGLPSGGLRGSEQGILPGVSSLGIRIVSTNLLVPEEDTAVIWRGPMITSAIKQFWSDVLWGKLDTLLIDLPPGTSDATLTVMQSLPLNGIILVTTPQQLASLVVRKAVHMVQQMNIPILGVVENMSYFTCPETGKQHAIFGPSHAEEIAKAAGTPVSACLPLDPLIATLGDQGKIEEASLEGMEAVTALVMQPKA
jgi:Mrp family chromosome partitioning ATPase